MAVNKIACFHWTTNVFVTWFAIFASTSWTSGFDLAAQAQTTCAGLLYSTPVGVRDAAADSAIQVLLGPLSRGTLEEAQSRVRLYPDREAVHIRETTALPDIAQWVRGTSADRNLVASALALIMRGQFGGFTAGQAVVASDLYLAWGLPFEQAGSVLRNPTESSSARALAVYSLSRYWNDERFVTAALGALCSLAARAYGIASSMSDAPPRIQLLLNKDEMALLEVTIRAFEKSERAGDLVKRLSQAADSGNLVVAYVRQWLDRSDH
jgi:hypothetical protein